MFVVLHHIQGGREGREKFISAKEIHKKKIKGGTSNDDKRINKPFQMVKHKAKAKLKRSRAEKNVCVLYNMALLLVCQEEACQEHEGHQVIQTVTT